LKELKMRDPELFDKTVAELKTLQNEVLKKRMTIPRKKELWDVKINVTNDKISPSVLSLIEDNVWQSLADELEYSVIVQRAKEFASEHDATDDFIVIISHRENSLYMMNQQINHSMKLQLPILNYGEEPPDFCPHCDSEVGEYRQFTEYGYSKDIYSGRESTCGARWVAHELEQPNGEWAVAYWTIRFQCGNPSLKAILGELAKLHDKDEMIELLSSFPKKSNRITN